MSDDLLGWRKHRIEALELALIQSRAKTAAAYEQAAEFVDKGHKSHIIAKGRNPDDYVSPYSLMSKAIRALATPEQSAALDAVKAEKLKENAKGIAEPCPCTLIEQDESCPVGYPSLLCSICQGTGNTTSDKVTALACEMLKIASDLGEAEDPFAAWEVIASLQEEAQLHNAIKAEARAQGMHEASEIAAEFIHRRLYEGNMPACSYHSRDVKTAILAAIQKGEPK